MLKSFLDTFSPLSFLCKIIKRNLKTSSKKKEFALPFDIEYQRAKYWTHIVVHHSATKDGIIHDRKNICRYHKSYRINSKIVAPPVNKKNLGIKYVTKRFKVKDNPLEYIARTYNANKVAKFNKIKKQRKGKGCQTPWSDEGYNFYVEDVNGELVYKLGRSLSIAGAHAYGFNNRAIGICNIGNYDNKLLTEERYRKLAALISYLMKRFRIPLENVLGHWEVYIELGQAKNKKEAWRIKSCPGKKASMVALRNYIREEAHV